MTATHNALMGALSRYSHLSELTEPLTVAGRLLTPAQRKALVLENLGLITSDTLTPGAGITSGVGTVYDVQTIVEGDLAKTRIFIDLTGLASSTTDLDIIGVGASPAHLGQVTAAVHGAPTFVAGRMVCIEAPAGGVTDIDLYVATEGTGVFDGGIAALAETAILTAGGAWTAGLSRPFTAAIAADKYLYLTCGAAGTPATYTAGRFMIEFEGSLFVGT